MEDIVKQSDMRCATCVNYINTRCYQSPVPVTIEQPNEHWCSLGHWRVWSERFNEWEPYYWGEWQGE